MRDTAAIVAKELDRVEFLLRVLFEFTECFVISPPLG